MIDEGKNMTKPDDVALDAGLEAFDNLRSANIARQAEWDADDRITLSYRGNELAGEVGEACNVIKKLDRERLGIRGSRDTVEHLAEELADVVICADLIAMGEGIDLLGEAVPAKFNATSEKVGLKTRLDRIRAYEAHTRPEPILRYCDYCKSWNSKPCGEGCVWRPDMPEAIASPAPSEADLSLDAPLVQRLERASAILANDDYTPPMTRDRARRVFVTETIIDAAAALRGTGEASSAERELRREVDRLRKRCDYYRELEQASSEDRLAMKEALRDVKLWTLFELKDNAARQPWKRRLDAIDAALSDSPASADRMEPGCCSAISPCSHQQKDPTTICDVCRDASAARHAGWRLVPVGPTTEMLNAAIDVDSFKLGDISPLGFRISPQQLFERCWSAMLTAAPAQPEDPRP